MGIKDYSGLPPPVRAEMLIGHLQDVLAQASATLASVKTRENHVVLHDDLNFLRQHFHATMQSVTRLQDHVACVMKELGKAEAETEETQS